ncbi:MAG: dethiobiotin synthase [Thaumarchaeota archaeon]|nr:dethiobiotin synthase [Nitrososphaerota archaeon]
MKSYFIAGTDTGVGKTTITAAIAASLRKRNIDVGVMKPVATGLAQKTGFKSQDVALLHDAAQVNDDEKTINPVFLPLPTSPYDASKILNMKIDMSIVFERYRYLVKSHQMVLVEGIGGIMTPITRDFFVADMIKQMNLETIVVTRSTLGTINHTVLTIELCKKYQIPVKGLIINYFDEKGGPAERNSPSTLHEVTGLPILGIIPFVKDYQKFEVMANVVEKNMDMNVFIS